MLLPFLSTCSALCAVLGRLRWPRWPTSGRSGATRACACRARRRVGRGQRYQRAVGLGLKRHLDSGGPWRGNGMAGPSKREYEPFKGSDLQERALHHDPVLQVDAVGASPLRVQGRGDTLPAHHLGGIREEREHGLRRRRDAYLAGHRLSWCLHPCSSAALVPLLPRVFRDSLSKTPISNVWQAPDFAPHREC